MILGVDPGFSGALAWYDTATGKIAQIKPIPLKEAGVFNTETRTEIDTVTLARLIGQTELRLAVVECVNSSPDMGVSSSFRFGQGFGQLQGILAALGIRTVYAYPAAWKAALQLSKNKDESRLLACQKFPEWFAMFKKGRKSSADSAEAALLAWYGTRFLPAPKI